MTGLLLSRRHRVTGMTTCDLCGDWSERTARFMFTTDFGDKKVHGFVDICAPCMREAVKVATEGRSVRR